MVALGVYGIALAAAAAWSLSMVIAKRGLSAEGTTLQLTVIVAGVDAAIVALPTYSHAPVAAALAG
jgi:hypothetical protein